MIGRLRGVVLEKQPPHLLLDVHGVGLELEAPMTTFYALPHPGSETTLYTHMVVREDRMLLYGFAHEQERRLFRLLTRVSGVGGKLALAILSAMEAGEFIDCIGRNDAARPTGVPGIGRKTAERLLVEMRDRLEGWEGTPGAASAARSATDDAVHALVALGYRPADAKRCAREVATPAMNSETVIRLSLKRLARL